MLLESVRLALQAAASRSCEISVGSGLLASLGERLSAAGGSRCVVIADAAVAGSHAATVTAGLHQAGLEVAICEVPSGEASKSIAEVSRLWNRFAELAVDRRTHVVAVGGGVVGDLAGFVAASYARGLPLWQVPTTLVAMVDSGIGGKTGINLPGGKNLVGAFWQPLGVVADLDTLASLPDREYRSGLAEVVKYGMILDADFFGWLEDHAVSLCRRDPEAVGRAVAVSARLKAGVVADDERELTGRRAILNYGHTFAHALETASGYGRLLHGEAVSLGMDAAARLAVSLGRIDGEIVRRQAAVLAACGLPTDCDRFLSGLPQAVTPQSLIEIMRRDKKAVGGSLRFVLPSRIGHVELVGEVDPSLVESLLRPANG